MYLPTELWQDIFEQLATENVHIFKQSTEYRQTKTRELQRLQLVCRKWRVHRT
jgi:hypothetical protein